MHYHCINKLLNIEEVIIKNISHSDTSVKIHLETKPKEHSCPLCGSLTKRIHDYRMQTIKDLPFQLKNCYLILKKRRYVCSCGKRFYENYSFLPRYFHRTSRLTAFIATALHDTASLASISKRCNVSTSTVNRILDTISVQRPTLSQTLSIDEFKGNAGAEKYQCILVDPLKHSVLDILPSRSQTFLTSYFRNIPKAERYRIKFFVCDMWRPYTDLAKTFFQMLLSSLINTTLSDKPPGQLKVSGKGFRKQCLQISASITKEAVPLYLHDTTSLKMKTKKPVI